VDSFLKSEGKRRLARPGPGARIILKCILRSLDGVACTGLIWLMIWTGGEHFSR